MEIFLRLIQGTYAYLLVFQILVVTGLVLALISLVVRRTREAHALASPESASNQNYVQTVVVDDGRVKDLEAKLGLLEDENSKLKASGGDTKSLKEKVKYLESKLLEYEILQEEIGTLSALKVENEQLKQQLVQAERAPKLKATPQAPIVEPDAMTAVPPMTVFFDGPAPDIAGGAPATAKEDGEAAASGLENLLAQIDNLAGPGDKGQGGGG